MSRSRIIVVGALFTLAVASCGDGEVEGATSTGTLSTTSSTTVAPASTSSSTEASTTTTSQVATTTTTEPPTTTSSSIPTLPPGVENMVVVNLINRYTFDAAPYRPFENREVEGSFVSHITLENVADDSQAPVYGLRLEFSTDLAVTVPDSSGTSVGALAWDFGDVEEITGPVRNPDSGVDFDLPVRFTPGMDVSMSYDRVAFSEPGTQTITLTIVARRDFSFWDFVFHLHGGHNKDGVLADVEVISFEPGDQVGPAGERIGVSPDRIDVWVDTLPPLAAGQTYTFEMTVSVDPKKPGIQYRPFVGIAWISDEGAVPPGTVTGNALSLPVGDLGTWEWTSAGPCTWWYQVGLQYELTLNG